MDKERNHLPLYPTCSPGVRLPRGRYTANILVLIPKLLYRVSRGRESPLHFTSSLHCPKQKFTAGETMDRLSASATAPTWDQSSAAFAGPRLLCNEPRTGRRYGSSSTSARRNNFLSDFGSRCLPQRSPLCGSSVSGSRKGLSRLGIARKTECSVSQSVMSLRARDL